MVRKVTAIQAHLKPHADIVNKMVDNVQRKFVVGNDDIWIEQLSDGRLRPHLTDSAKARLYPSG